MADPQRDDRLLGVVRATGIVVAPIVALAFVVLFFFPERTSQLWAWTIRSRATAMFLGSTYLIGCFYFVQVIRASRWHQVAAVFLGVTGFTWMMLAATLFHWDKFRHASLPFALWLGLYVVAPVAIPVLWWRNRKHDPGWSETTGVRVPLVWRRVVGVCGGLLILTSLALFTLRLQAVWPWELTPLTSRVLGACHAVAGTILLALACEPRWTGWRRLVPGAIGWFGLALVVALRARDELRPVAAPVYLIANALLGGFLAVLFARFERRHASQNSGSR